MGIIMDLLTVPIQIDSIKDIRDFENTRCIYFRVEIAESELEEASHFEGWEDDNLLLIGHWAVLTGPIGNQAGTNKFTSPDLITNTFDKIYNHPELNLELCHFWVPNQLIAHFKPVKEIRCGDIYRLSARLFNLCHRRSPQELLAMSPEILESKAQMEIQDSAEETRAFRIWRKARIDEFKERHYAKGYQSRRLEKRNLEGGERHAIS